MNKNWLLILGLVSSLSFANDDIDKKDEIITPSPEGRIFLANGGRTVELTYKIPSFDDSELNEAINRLTKAVNEPVLDTQWEYGRLDNEFDDKVSKVARLFSNDYNAILFIAYDIKDEQYKSPQVGLQLSGGISNGNWHNFLCTENCLNIDLNVDGKKYPNIKMDYGGAKTLLAKQPKTFLNYIKTGETIKVRVPSISGSYLVYVFEPNEILDLSQLKQLE